MQTERNKNSELRAEAINLLTQYIDAKIKFQLEKIKIVESSNDFDLRQKEIKQLQKLLFEAKSYFEKQK